LLTGGGIRQIGGQSGRLRAGRLKLRDQCIERRPRLRRSDCYVQLLAARERRCQQGQAGSPADTACGTRDQRPE
jgi:hypothetical protein